VLWTAKPNWTGARLFWIAALCLAKRSEDTAYGWEGKGSTMHMLTEVNGLPPAFLVTTANVAEVGVKAVGQVRVPDPKDVLPKESPSPSGSRQEL
jgi:hypothetical protein